MVGLLEKTRSSQPGKEENKNRMTKNNFHNDTKILEELNHPQLMKKTDDDGKLNNDDVDDGKTLNIPTTLISAPTATTTIDNTDEAVIIENVKLLLDEVLILVENSLNKNGEHNDVEHSGMVENGEHNDVEHSGMVENGEHNDVEHSGMVENEEEGNKHKGILKRERTYSNKHVDFDLALKYIPFDPKKDYTIDIQFVETIKKRVVSYAAMYAQNKEEEEAAAVAAAKATATEQAEEMKQSVETAEEEKNIIETNSIIVEG